jgi:hypothetical protein
MCEFCGDNNLRLLVRNLRLKEEGMAKSKSTPNLQNIPIKTPEGTRVRERLTKACPCGSGLPSRELLDARGIYCGRVCDKCEAKTREMFRSTVFTDPHYEADEPIEEDE